MQVTVFPMLTPFFYSEFIEILAVKNNLTITSSRMQPHYKNKTKKRKRK